MSAIKTISILAKFRSNRFMRDVVRLSSGTVGAQLIGFVALPILTRIFTPQALGEFAVYAAVTWIGAVFSTFQFEHLIPQPRRRMAGISIFFGGVVFSTLFVSLISSALLFYKYVADEVPVLGTHMSSWLIFVPPGILVISLSQHLRYLCIRENKFGTIGAGVMARSSAHNGISILLGWLRWPASGGLYSLVFGQILGYVADITIMARQLNRTSGQVLWRALNTRRIKIVMVYYARRASALTLAHSIKTGSSRVGVVIVGLVGSPAVVGYYALVERLVSAPIGLLAQPVSDVFRQRATVQYNSTGSFRSLLVWTVSRTAIVGIPCFGFAAVIAPDAFGFLFGREWRIAGEYAVILLAGELAAFIFLPINPGAIILNLNIYIIGWHSAQLASRLALVPYCIWQDCGVFGLFIGMASIKIIAHLVDFAVIFSWSKKSS